MRKLVPLAALAAALAVAACDKPRTQSSAYNNSGASATPAMPAEQPAQAATTPAPAEPQQPQATTSPATSDTASPSAAPVTK